MLKRNYVKEHRDMNNNFGQFPTFATDNSQIEGQQQQISSMLPLSCPFSCPFSDPWGDPRNLSFCPLHSSDPASIVGTETLTTSHHLMADLLTSEIGRDGSINNLSCWSPVSLFHCSGKFDFLAAALDRLHVNPGYLLTLIHPMPHRLLYHSH